MPNNRLIKIAYEFFEKNSLFGIYKISDIGDRIVAFGGDPNRKIYGCRSVEVNKITGEVKMFCSWLPENEKLLDNSFDITIPKEYLYREGA